MFNRMETKPEYQAVGLELTVRYDDTSVIAGKWGEFMQRAGEIPQAVKPAESLGIVLSANDEEFVYLISKEAGAVDPLPSGMTAHTIPANDYAVFTHRGAISKLGETFQYIFSQWLPQSEYDRTDAPATEVYGENYGDGSSEDSSFEIWIPVVKK